MKFLITIALIVLSGCTLPRPSPKDIWDAIEIKDQFYIEKIAKATTQKTDNNFNILLISAGGTNGAWGAGVLGGWRESKNGRPRFDVVTGVSTGSLIATFAFLDTPLYDQILQAAYISIRSEDMLNRRPWLKLPFGNSVNTSSNLEKLINRWITNKVIDDVATESKTGRMLFVGSTNLDAGILQIWDLSEMAQNKQYDKYRQALLASSSIPILFPPVFIDGAMHYDGSLREPMFLRESLIPKSIKTNIYVIINTRPGGIGKFAINNNIKDISLRAIYTMTDASVLTALGYIKFIGLKYKANVFVNYVEKDVRLLDFNATPDDLISMYNSGFESGRLSRWIVD